MAAVDLPSPTEVATASEVDVDEEEVDAAARRDARRARKSKRRAEEEAEASDASPSKTARGRPSAGSGHGPEGESGGGAAGGGGGDVDAIRRMLEEHLSSMRSSWGSVAARVERVEVRQAEHADRISTLEDAGDFQARRTESLGAQIEGLEQKMEALSRDLASLKVGGAGIGAGLSNGGAHPDPWQECLTRAAKGDGAGGDAVGGGGGGGGGGGRGGGGSNPKDSKDGGLSEEDRRTLIFGGWLQDTKKATILAEVQAAFQLPEVAPLLDNTDLIVFGPRRSFGMLRFVHRQGEDHQQLRERMWGVIRAVRGATIALASTAAPGGEAKKLWSSFLKTREARKRGGHASMIRRVAQTCAEGGEGDIAVEARGNDYYDVDWASGTVWAGLHKLGSAVHRRPRSDDVCQLGAGWVDVGEVAAATGADKPAVKAVLEREL